MNWLGILFIVLYPSAWSDVGTSTKMFSTEQECWDYYHNITNWTLIEERQNFYNSSQTIKIVDTQFGTAFITCKPFQTN